METEIVWGEPIPAANGGMKPEWLDDEQQVSCYWKYAPGSDGMVARACDVSGWGDGFQIRLPADHPHYQQTQWGDPIEVNGVRPEWLGDDELILPQETGEVDWDDPLDVAGCRVWEMIPTIRLPRDHPAYTALAAGFTPWGGGWTAPDDADLFGGAILRSGMALTGDVHEVRWTHEGNAGDIIGYRKRVSLTATPEPTTAEDMIADFYQEFGGAVIGTDNPRHLRILDALADVDEGTVVVKRMTEGEVWADVNANEGRGMSWREYIVAFAQRHGLITTPTTPLAQFIAANPGVVNEENRAAVELALGWGN